MSPVGSEKQGTFAHPFWFPLSQLMDHSHPLSSIRISPGGCRAKPLRGREAQAHRLPKRRNTEMSTGSAQNTEISASAGGVSDWSRAAPRVRASPTHASLHRTSPHRTIPRGNRSITFSVLCSPQKNLSVFFASLCSLLSALAIPICRPLLVNRNFGRFAN
jgi:hypothetical protein